MNEPLVSVIVGVYDKERYVGECLRSVMDQTYRHFELIVVDDASEDCSLQQILTIRDDRTRVVAMEKNSGHPGVPRNRGIRMAQGQYLAFLDADDVWMPEKLEKQVAYMEAHPEYPFSHMRCWVIDAAGNELYLRHGGDYPLAGDCFVDLMMHCFICTSSVMLRRSLVEQIGVFSEEDCFKSGQDYEYFVRCAKAVGVGIPEGVWVKYRNFPDTVSRHTGNWRSIPRDFIRHRIFLSRKSLWSGKLDESTVRWIAWGAAEENAYYWRQRRKFAKAAWFAAQMIWLKPFRTGGWRQLLAASARR
jgi:glycosyltransferase involved in cell wall biosynthesis